MIREDEIVEIGKFQKTHALKGELNAILDIDESYLEDGNPLVVEMDGINVPFYPEGVRPKGATSYLVKLKGVDDVEAADAFVNKTIYGLRSDLLNYFDSPEEEIVFDNDLIGYSVIDVDKGLLGTLESIDDSTVNTLMVVDSDRYGEIYIPYNEDFIEQIDDTDKEITVNLPEGLLTLNEKKQ